MSAAYLAGKHERFSCWSKKPHKAKILSNLHLHRLSLNSRMLHKHLPVLESYILTAGVTRNILEVSINFLWPFCLTLSWWQEINGSSEQLTSECTKNHRCPSFPAPHGLKKELITLLKNITFIITWMVRNQSCPKRMLENISKIYDRQNGPKKGSMFPATVLD